MITFMLYDAGMKTIRTAINGVTLLIKTLITELGITWHHATQAGHA